MLREASRRTRRPDRVWPGLALGALLAVGASLSCSSDPPGPGPLAAQDEAAISACIPLAPDGPRSAFLNVLAAVGDDELPDELTFTGLRYEAVEGVSVDEVLVVVAEGDELVPYSWDLGTDPDREWASGFGSAVSFRSEVFPARYVPDDGAAAVGVVVGVPGPVEREPDPAEAAVQVTAVEYRVGDDETTYVLPVDREIWVARVADDYDIGQEEFCARYDQAVAG